MPRSRREIGRALLGIALVAGAGFLAIGVLRTRHDDRIDSAGLVLVTLTCAAVAWAGASLVRRAVVAVRAPVEFDVPGVVRPVQRLEAVGPQRDAAVLLDGVSVRIGSRLILDDIGARVSRGEIVGLLGPNGAGKTTTVDVVCGLRSMDRGRAEVLGHDVRTAGAELRRAIGVVPQDTGLYPELTAVEHLELFSALYDVSNRRQRIDEVLELLGLSQRRDSRVGSYSGGMKRRLALARALLHDPPVLFLDEPTLGVDVHGRRALWEHVLRLRDEGRAVLLTTNYLEEATALCDRVVIIDHGRVVADASPESLRRDGGSSIVLTVDGDPATVVATLVQRCGVEAAVEDGGVVRVGLPRQELAATVVRVAGEVGEVRELRTEQPSLDDVFLRLTGRELSA